MTGMPHRPSSSDGHLLCFVSPFLNRYRAGAEKMPVAIARPIGYAYRLGRCGDWRYDVRL